MIESPLLPCVQGYVGGAWRSADSGGTFAVHNPATGDRLADAPAMGEAETRAAVEAAAEAMDRVPDVAARAAWLAAIAQALLDQKQELGRIITLEQGKPLKEGVGEVEYAAGFFRFFLTQLHHLEPRPLPEPIRGCRWTVHHRAAGVAGLITPWNFPLAMLAKKLAPALGAGCGVVIKPAEQTPLTAIALMALIERLRVDALPRGLVNLVTGDPAAIGEVLCTHPLVRLISFTGSTEVGRLLMAKVAPHVKRLALELGGNAPFIVFDDADLDAAAEGLMGNKFRAGGQTCVCANRVYVQRGAQDQFAGAVKRRVEKLRVGDGLDPQTDIGPLIDAAGFDKVARHVRDAIDRGARRVAGFDPPRPRQDWGCFYPPTVFAGVSRDMLVTREETFGPVIALLPFGDEAEAIAAANDTEFGLAAYLYTTDAKRARRVVPQLRFGHVGVNTGTGPTPEAPFGGMKQSGFGREGGVEGLMEFVETQTVAEG